MNNSFGFFNMAGTIQQRRVKHFEDIKRHVVVIFHCGRRSVP